jgi:hypothetical protein
MGMAEPSTGPSTVIASYSSNDTSGAIFGSTNSHVYYVSNFTYSTIAYRNEQKDEEDRKLEHARQMRKRNLGYLWREFHGLDRLRFQVRAPQVRFLTCWSARRWRSRTSTHRGKANHSQRSVLRRYDSSIKSCRHRRPDFV